MDIDKAPLHLIFELDEIVQQHMEDYGNIGREGRANALFKSKKLIVEHIITHAEKIAAVLERYSVQPDTEYANVRLEDRKDLMKERREGRGGCA